MRLLRNQSVLLILLSFFGAAIGFTFAICLLLTAVDLGRVFDPNNPWLVITIYVVLFSFTTITGMFFGIWAARRLSMLREDKGITRVPHPLD